MAGKSAKQGGLIPAADARKILLDHIKPLDSETVSLSEADGRVLAADLKALRTQPPFNASAMDGFAVNSGDLANLPASLDIAGVSRAGESFGNELKSGEAVRVFTGAVVPEGADTIIIQENTEFDAAKVKVLKGENPGRYIRPAGLDFRSGETLLQKGDVMNPIRISLAAAMNHAAVEVVRKPLVGLISTGDELVKPGSEIGEAQIVASNMFGLEAACQSAGAEVNNLGIVRDERDLLREAFVTCIDAGANLILTSGGASVGDHDLVLPVAEELGFRFLITKIAMRPGKPFLFGVLDNSEREVFLIGLAGNPVSSHVAFEAFGRPAVARFAGMEDRIMAPMRGILGSHLPANDEREEYMRARLEETPDGEIRVKPMEKQDSSMLANLSRADCLLIRPANAPAANAGDPCEYVTLQFTHTNG